MKSFKDTEGREWVVRVTLAEVEAFLDAGIDLGKKEHFDAVFNDTRTFLRVLEVVLTEQMKKFNLTPAQVRAAFDGEVTNAAAEAIQSELFAFFQNSPGRKKLVEAVTGRATELEKQAEERMLKLAEAVTAGELDKKIFPALSSTVTGSPQPPELEIPAA